MKKVILILLSSIILLSLIVLFALSQPTLSPNLEKCNTLSESGGSTNIVFFTDRETAKRYTELFFEISPFKENQDSFNFYYITSYEPNCKLYSNIALFCYSRDLIRKASACPADIIVTVQEKPSNIRSSSYLNVLSLNSKNPDIVFLHEFGHAFANFAEEYVPAKIPSKSKNCQKKCSDFSSSQACFNGCSKLDYSRSIDKGIMRTLNSKTFGEFDESLLLEKIKSKSKLTGRAISETKDCKSECYYLIEGKLIDNSIEILSKTVEYGCPGSNGEGGFTYKLVSGQEVLSESTFNPELIFTDAPGEDEISGETFESEESFILRVPVSQAQTLEILNGSDSKISEINLHELSQIPCKIQ